MIAWLHGFRPWQDKSIMMEMYSGGGGSCPALRLPGAEMKEKWLLSDLLPPTDPSVLLNYAHMDNAFSFSVLKILTPASSYFPPVSVNGPYDSTGSSKFLKEMPACAQTAVHSHHSFKIESDL